MCKKSLTLLPASIPAKRFKKSDTEGRAVHQRSDEEAATQADQKLQHLRQLATTGKVDEFRGALTELASQKKATAKLPRRVHLELICCRTCWSGYLRAALLTGQVHK